MLKLARNMLSECNTIKVCISAFKLHPDLCMPSWATCLTFWDHSTIRVQLFCVSIPIPCLSYLYLFLALT